MKCPECGREFERKSPVHKYCSPECAMNHQIGVRKTQPFTLTCLQCGKTFRSFSSKSKFCSSKCYNESRIVKTCPGCGKTFETTNPGKVFCTQECRLDYRRAQMKLADKPKTGKTLEQWTREANECNLDYGNYRALIAAGKTYAELKATASQRQPLAHSNVKKTHI